MKFQRGLIVVFIATFLINCSGEESTFNCFGASSPVDLTLQNKENHDNLLTFFHYSEKEGFHRIGTLKVGAMSQKTICLENEGPIVEGLYVYDGKKTFKIKLTWDKNFILNLSDSTYLIATPSELGYLGTINNSR